MRGGVYPLLPRNLLSQVTSSPLGGIYSIVIVDLQLIDSGELYVFGRRLLAPLGATAPLLRFRLP